MEIRLKSDLSKIDLLVVETGGWHINEDIVPIGVIDIDDKGDKPALGLVEGVTENAVGVQSLLGNLLVRGFDLKIPRLFAEAPSKSRIRPVKAALPSEAYC